jgi:hypothetical protein
MGDRSERQATLSGVDSTHSNAPAEPGHLSSGEHSQQSQPTMLELNSVLLIVMGGLAALFTAMAFLLCLS